MKIVSLNTHTASQVNGPPHLQSWAKKTSRTISALDLVTSKASPALTQQPLNPECVKRNPLADEALLTLAFGFCFKNGYQTSAVILKVPSCLLENQKHDQLNNSMVWTRSNQQMGDCWLRPALQSFSFLLMKPKAQSAHAALLPRIFFLIQCFFSPRHHTTINWQCDK